MVVAADLDQIKYNTMCMKQKFQIWGKTGTFLSLLNCMSGFSTLTKLSYSDLQQKC